MSTESPQDENLVKLEQSLRSLSPRPTTLNRDALIFAAGQQAASHRANAGSTLRLLTAACVAIAVGFMTGRMSATQTTTPSQTPIAVEIPPSSPVEMPSLSRLPNYLLLRDRTLREGVDALAAQPSATEEQPTYDSPLQWRSLHELPHSLDHDISPARKPQT